MVGAGQIVLLAVTEEEVTKGVKYVNYTHHGDHKKPIYLIYTYGNE